MSEDNRPKGKRPERTPRTIGTNVGQAIITAYPELAPKGRRAGKSHNRKPRPSRVVETATMPESAKAAQRLPLSAAAAMRRMAGK